MAQAEQRHAQEDLEAAARTLYAATAVVKYYTLHQLIQHKGPLTLEEAARAARVPAQTLKLILKADRVFAVTDGVPAGGICSIELVEHELLKAAARHRLKREGRQQQEVSVIRRVAHMLLKLDHQPGGYVQGIYPVRPGRPTCYYWTRHRRCSHNQLCVFNHPADKPSSGPQPAPPNCTKKQAKEIRKASRLQARLAVQAAAARALQEMAAFEQTGSCGSDQLASSCSSCIDIDSSSYGSSQAVPPCVASCSSSGQFAAVTDSGDSAGFSSSSGWHSSNSSLPAIYDGYSGHRWYGRSLRLHALPILPPLNRKLSDPHDWLPDKMAKGAAQAGSQGRPGGAAAAAAAAAVESQEEAAARVWGAACVVDPDAAAAVWHGGEVCAASPLRAASGVADGEPGHSSVAAAGAGAGDSAGAWGGPYSGLQAQQEQEEVAAVAAAEPSAGPCQLDLTHGPCLLGTSCRNNHRPVLTGTSITAPAAAVSQCVQASHTSLFAAAPAATASGSSSSSSAAHASKELLPELQQHVWPSLGYNAEGLPQYRGAPNCTHYLSAGRCKAGRTCRHHHPEGVLLPECSLQGFVPCPCFPDHPAAFGRLVVHLQRLWDYEACAESQLKIWLAYYLLAAENTGCSMFAASAGRHVVEEEHEVSQHKPLGLYSCTLGTADAVLQAMWAAAPGESAADPMPYAGCLADLLAGDPYLQLYEGLQGGSEPQAVKLKVQAVKELLNF